VDTPEYGAATDEFSKRYMCRLDPLPKEVIQTFMAWKEDPTVTETMFGKSDFDISGSLRSWTVEKDLKKLTVELVPGGILLMNGYFDLEQNECMLPFFTEPSAKVKWVRFGLSAHGPQLEETEKYIKALGDFLEN
jgi:hypothetical protein